MFIFQCKLLPTVASPHQDKAGARGIVFVWTSRAETVEDTDPMVTGLPQHWKGKPAADLKAAMGEPTRIIPQSTGAEVWEYVRSEQVLIPKGENSSFAFGLAGGGKTLLGELVASRRRSVQKIALATLTTYSDSKSKRESNELVRFPNR